MVLLNFATQHAIQACSPLWHQARCYNTQLPRYNNVDLATLIVPLPEGLVPLGLEWQLSRNANLTDMYVSRYTPSALSNTRQSSPQSQRILNTASRAEKKGDSHQANGHRSMYCRTPCPRLAHPNQLECAHTWDVQKADDKSDKQATYIQASVTKTQKGCISSQKQQVIATSLTKPPESGRCR